MKSSKDYELDKAAKAAADIAFMQTPAILTLDQRVGAAIQVYLWVLETGDGKTTPSARDIYNFARGEQV